MGKEVGDGQNRGKIEAKSGKIEAKAAKRRKTQK
jgi:hypothetical protein